MDGFLFFVAIIAIWICCFLYDDIGWMPSIVALALNITMIFLAIGTINHFIKVENTMIYSITILLVPVILIVAIIPIEVFGDARYNRLAKLEEEKSINEEKEKRESITNCKYRFVEDEEIYCCKATTTIKTTQRSCEVCKNV